MKGTLCWWVLPLAAASVPSVVNIGALFPMFRASNQNLDSSGQVRFAAFLLALQLLNNKTDGAYDDILPRTTLRYAFRDSKRNNVASYIGAAQLADDVFGGAGVSAIVGAASSDPSAFAAEAAGSRNVPQISYSSTSARLSDGRSYPYFLRTVPSDAFQGQALADVACNLFRYRRVAIVSSADSYGSSGREAFLSGAADQGLTILASPSVSVSSSASVSPSDFVAAYAELTGVDAHVIVLFLPKVMVGPFLRGAYARGIGGRGCALARIE